MKTPYTLGNFIIGHLALIMLVPLFMVTGWFQGGSAMTLGEWLRVNRISPDDE